MANYDVVVVGAGNGGLTAAVSLAKKGLKTLLLERHNVPGGCATSFTRGRFEFEVALHQLSGMGSKEMPGPLRMFLSGLEVLDDLEWVEMKNLYRIIGPQQLDLTLGANREAMIETLQQKFPAESQGISDFFALLYNFFLEVINGFFMKDPEMAPAKYPLYFEYALKNTEDVVSQFISDPLLKSAIYPYWSYMAVPPSALAFSDYAALMFSYLEFKPYHLKGGSQALSNALINKFLGWGGEVRFNCGAKKILVENGQVTGVITDNDETIITNFVVSNASTLAVYTEMIDRDQVPDEQFKVLGGSNVGVSSFTIYVGLDCEPQTVGINETTNFIFPSTDMDHLLSRAKVLDASADGILLTCYNLSDPEASPPGTSQIAIVDVKYFDAWKDVAPSDYYR
ncbi:MAG: phytoene desaturase family protein, partial [Methanomassiliicoccales archaeon]